MDHDRRKELVKEVKQYKRKIGKFTGQESELLRKWVSAGNSPYMNNLDVCDAYGIPVDYISAFRFTGSLQYDGYSDAVIASEEENNKDDKTCGSEELPF